MPRLAPAVVGPHVLPCSGLVRVLLGCLRYTRVGGAGTDILATPFWPYPFRGGLTGLRCCDTYLTTEKSSEKM